MTDKSISPAPFGDAENNVIITHSERKNNPYQNNFLKSKQKDSCPIGQGKLGFSLNLTPCELKSLRLLALRACCAMRNAHGATVAASLESKIGRAHV